MKMNSALKWFHTRQVIVEQWQRCGFKSWTMHPPSLQQDQWQNDPCSWSCYMKYPLSGQGILQQFTISECGPSSDSGYVNDCWSNIVLWIIIIFSPEQNIWRFITWSGLWGHLDTGALQKQPVMGHTLEKPDYVFLQYLGIKYMNENQCWSRILTFLVLVAFPRHLNKGNKRLTPAVQQYLTHKWKSKFWCPPPSFILFVTSSSIWHF